MLQTLGLRPARVFRLVVAESVIMCAVGGIAGTAIALALLAWSGMSVGAEAVTIAFRPSWSLAGFGCAISLVVGLVAGVIPAYQAARAEIVIALREA